MPPVTTWRLLALRALYAMLAIGLGVFIWPSLLTRGAEAPQSGSVVQALLGALGLLAVLGIRYPLQMLPLLLFELLWKVVWALAVALPAWQHGTLGEYGIATFYECLPVYVLFPIIIPWRYVIARYVRAPGEPWRRTHGNTIGNSAG